MPPMSATHVTRRVVAEADKLDEKGRLLPWRPIQQTISIAREPPTPRTMDEQKQRTKRDILATSANQRYDEWKGKNPTLSRAEKIAAEGVSVHFPVFRERKKHKEIAGEFAHADRVLHERQRIDQAVSESTAAFLQNPPYPKQGGGTKNLEFSYMSAGYDYRQRQPSKEVSGTWPIMRTRALTESARINEAVATERPRDTAGGGRWTIDHRYGNPPTFSPLPTGQSFRQATPRKWIGPQDPPHTAPNRRITEGNKWRGGFKTNFPPRTATAEPLDGKTPWLHHTEAFEDRFHETVAVHIPESIKHGGPSYRTNRQKGLELTVGAVHQFWPQYTGDAFVPNPSATCTWNVVVPPSPLPPRRYPKSPQYSPRRGLDAGGDLVSASQVQESGVTSTGSA